MVLSQGTVGGRVDREVEVSLSSGGNIENSPGPSVHHLSQLSKDWQAATALPGLEGLVTLALDGQEGRQGPILDSLHGLNVKFPSLEVTAGQVERFTILTARLRSNTFVGVEIHMTSGEGGAHPVACRVNDVHKLCVRPVQSVPGPHTVEQRTTGVQPCDPTQGPSCEVSHIACSLGTQGTAQHMNLIIAHSHLGHQPGHELPGLPAHHLGVLTGRVVPGRQGQLLPVHGEHVVFSNMEISPPQSLQITLIFRPNIDYLLK